MKFLILKRKAREQQSLEDIVQKDEIWRKLVFLLQTPFVNLFMYLGEVPEGQTKDDLAMIIEEVIKQRIQGMKNEKGVWITPAFP